MTERTYTLTAAQLNLLGQCIARAQAVGAFADCVVPSIGEKALALIERTRADTDLNPIAARVYRADSWGGSPAPHIAGATLAELDALKAAGWAKRNPAGWWIPTARFPAPLTAKG